MTIGTPALWIAFNLFVLAMLALDLGVFNRKAHAPSLKEAAIWSGVWIARLQRRPLRLAGTGDWHSVPHRLPDREVAQCG